MSKIIITETQLGILKGLLMEDPLSTSKIGFISPLTFPSGVTYPQNGFQTQKKDFGKYARPNHNGVDLAAGSSSRVVAPADGKVTRKKYKGGGGCGGLIRIQHKEYETAYCHMKAIYVKEGEKVKQGQLIGLSGGSSKDPYAGNSQGAHLHFQMKKGNYYGQLVDPMKLIDYKKNYIKTADILNPEDIVIDPNYDVLDDDVISLGDGSSGGRRWKKEAVKEMQGALLALDYKLPIHKDDGEFGTETLKAVNKFQTDNGFEESIFITPEMIDIMKNESGDDLASDDKSDEPSADEPSADEPSAEESSEEEAEEETEIVKKEKQYPFDDVVVDAIIEASEKTGVDEDLLFTIANIASGGDPNRKNGLFRLSQKYWGSFGVDATSVKDPHKNSLAAAKKIQKTIDRLKSFLGREPEMYETYVAYSQGRRGFRVIKTACDNFASNDVEESLKLSSEELGYSPSYGSHVYKNMKRSGITKPCEFLEDMEDEVVASAKEIQNL